MKTTNRTKQDALLLALLSEPTIEAACRAAAVPKSTATLWLKDADFKARLNTARNEIFLDALSVLKAAARAAAIELLSLLKTRDPSVRRLAAESILRAAFKGYENLDFEARLSELEKLLVKPGVNSYKERSVN